MTKSARVRYLLASTAFATLAFASFAVAQQPPNTTELLGELGLPDDAVQRVLAGEFVTADVPPVSERDLSIAIAFLVKSSPADLRQQVMAGNLISADPNVKANGEIKGAPGDLAALPVANTDALASAQPGSDLNFATAEFAALQAAGGGGIQTALQGILFKRYQAYRTSGLAGISPYDRGGKFSDPAADLRTASASSKGLKKYLPALQSALIGYPKTTAPGMTEKFYWFVYSQDGKPTYVLTHIMSAPDGNAAAVVQRQYYVSAGYNAEQAVAGFLPVTEGTAVVYVNHTFTDQVAGFGGSMKRSIGRNMMESQLKQVFDTARSMAKP